MKHRIILIGIASVLLAASCNKILDYHEYSYYDKEYMTRNFGNVGGFMTGIYNTLEYDFGNYSDGAMLASASDESEYSIMGNAIEDFYNGAWSPTNAKSSTWTNMYKGISTANLLLKEFQGLTFDDLQLNKDYPQQMYRYKNYAYEARLMRAFFYFYLVRQYGGVPIVKEGMSLEEINSLSRSTSDEVFQYIISECNDIKDVITKDHTDLGDFALGSAETGRADQLTVLAVRARAALYWASPLFNPNNDANRWKTAAQYYKELIAECQKRGKDFTAKYEDTWATLSYSTASIAKEIVFARRYYSSSTGDNLVEKNNYPVGIEGGKGGNCPTQNLVDAYDMKKSGKAITEEGSGYDPQNPYEGRDPRLALTVAYNGSQWPLYSEAPLLQTFQGGVNGQPLAGATTTGYYLRKLCHGEISLAANSKLTANIHQYVLFRMGDIWLDYAECLFRHLGSADATSADFPISAREAASKTRVRVGMPAFPEGMSKDAFWEKYKNERMVELAFEGHRFWDLRRWKEADKYLKTIKRMNITKANDGKLTYSVSTVNRQWNDKMYLFPIPMSERMKNKNLTQNPGWE